MGKKIEKSESALESFLQSGTGWPLINSEEQRKISTRRRRWVSCAEQALPSQERRSPQGCTVEGGSGKAFSEAG